MKKRPGLAHFLKKSFSPTKSEPPMDLQNCNFVMFIVTSLAEFSFSNQRCPIGELTMFVLTEAVLEWVFSFMLFFIYNNNEWIRRVWMQPLLDASPMRWGMGMGKIEYVGWLCTYMSHCYLAVVEFTGLYLYSMFILRASCGASICKSCLKACLHNDENTTFSH